MKKMTLLLIGVVALLALTACGEQETWDDTQWDDTGDDAWDDTGDDAWDDTGDDAWEDPMY